MSQSAIALSLNRWARVGVSAAATTIAAGFYCPSTLLAVAAASYFGGVSLFPDSLLRVPVGAQS